MSVLRRPGPEMRRLHELEPFRDFSDAELEQILSYSSHATLPKNWPLLHEETPADAVYIVMAGRLAVFIHKERVAEIGPGELIGEAALRAGKLRNATVTTMEKSEFLRIDKDDLDAVFTAVPRLRQAIDAAAARHAAAAEG